MKAGDLLRMTGPGAGEYAEGYAVVLNMLPSGALGLCYFYKCGGTYYVPGSFGPVVVED